MPDAITIEAGIDFVLTLRRRWADTLYPRVRAEFDAARMRTGTSDPVESVVHALPTFPWFAWLERGSQKMLWRAVDDAVAARPHENLDEIAPASLEFDPFLSLPDWYTQWDIHLQPGGVWSSEASAAVYELGARLVMLGENDDYRFHRLFTETAIPDRDYRLVVDLGCGFGKSTWPLKRRFPYAEVVGVDLAAPCLTLAAHRAGQQGLAIRFRQANATGTGLAPASASLVTSTMLVHELPIGVLQDVFVEAERLLEPGGLLRFLDFHSTGDPFRDLAMFEHGARNNEPYLPPMLRTDVVAMARDAGLARVRWLAFDERERGRLEQLAWPERPDWHFPWAVLEAEKPA
jgi:SAM-dependent methyltransferase